MVTSSTLCFSQLLKSLCRDGTKTRKARRGRGWAEGSRIYSCLCRIYSYSHTPIPLPHAPLLFLLTESYFYTISVRQQCAQESRLLPQPLGINHDWSVREIYSSLLMEGLRVGRNKGMDVCWSLPGKVFLTDNGEHYGERLLSMLSFLLA